MGFLEKKLEITLPTRTDEVNPRWLPKNCRLFVKRDDLMHPVISGNKYRKLKPLLNHIVNRRIKRVYSFGGPHSNHLHALAFACNRLGLHLTAFVRGQHHSYKSKTIQDIENWGAEVRYLTNNDYKLRDTGSFQQKITHQTKSFCIPEGGSHPDFLAGISDIWSELDQDYHQFWIPVGSAGTLSGLVKSKPEEFSGQLHGVSALKNGEYLQQRVEHWSQKKRLVQFHFDAHCGGFGKMPDYLIAFCQEFAEDTGIELDPVYTGKLMLAIKNRYENIAFSTPTDILSLHTGGLQGARP